MKHRPAHASARPHPSRRRPGRPPPPRRGLARGGLEPPDHPGAAWSPAAQVLVEDTADGRTELVLMPLLRRARQRGAPLLPGHRRGRRRATSRCQQDAPARPDGRRRPPAGLREVGGLLSRRATPGLMVHAVALENWQRLHRFCSRCGEPHRHRRRRARPPLHLLRRRALPAHRPGGDHAGHRRPGPRPARPPDALAGGPLLHARRVRRARRVDRAGGGPRGRRRRPGVGVGRGRATSPASRGRSRPA